MNNKPVAWMVERTTGTKGYGDTPYVTLLDATKSTYWIENKIPEGYTVIPLYTHPVKELNDGGEPVKNATYWKRQYNLMASQNDNLKSGLYHANEQIKYLESHPVKEQDESFDRTASHMAGEYVSYKSELTDELNNLKKENKFFKEILSEMDKQVYNIEFLKQPMQILENGQIVPLFKELTDEEIISEWVGCERNYYNFARAILLKAQEK